MTVRLRPHHLLCMLTYVGKGYTSGFVENYDRVAARLNAGEEDIELVDGPDDICTGLLCESHAHCFNEGVVQRDEAARLSVSTLLNETLSPRKTAAGHAGLSCKNASRLRCRRHPAGLPWLPVDKAVRPYRGIRLCRGEDRRAAANDGQARDALFQPSDAQT